MTFLSYLIIPTYFLKRDSLFKLLIILVPFTSSSVFNVPGGLWIQPSLIIILYIFLKYSLLCNEAYEKRTLTLLTVVIISVCLSNLLVILNGSVFIESTLLNKLNFYITYSSRHLTFLLYLILGFLFLPLVSNHYKNIPQKLIDIYLFSSILVCSIIILQFVLKLFGLPDAIIYLLNNNATFTSHMQVYEGTNTYRFSGPGIEPSVIAKFAAPSFFIVLSKLNSKKYLVLLTILLLAMLLTKSTTFYAGFFFSLIFILLRHMNLKIIMVLTPIVILFLIIILEKFDSGSGSERVMVFSNNLTYFFSRPFFGNGYGILPNNDMISFILASGGVIGILSFFYLLYYPYINRDRSCYEINNVFIIAILLQITSGLDYGNMQFYFFLSMIYASYLHRRVASK